MWQKQWYTIGRDARQVVLSSICGFTDNPVGISLRTSGEDEEQKRRGKKQEENREKMKEEAHTKITPFD